jgi:Pyridoxamine 5'-phosphate oxidase
MDDEREPRSPARSRFAAATRRSPPASRQSRPCKYRRMMDVAERAAMARAIVDSNSYMTLGTADADGLPWASPVWYAPASYREFFWVSKPGARHSHNITVRPEVGIVIFDSTVPISTGKAVYMAARAAQVTTADEIERGMSIFSRRSLEQGGREWTPDDVGATARLRLYRATASEQFVLSPGDERLPFRLE